MMKNQDYDLFALIEFGEEEKTGYVFVKGGDWVCTDPTLAHTYWYPNEITQEEASQEVLDLCENYKNVAIVLPIPEHLSFEGIAQ